MDFTRAIFVHRFAIAENLISTLEELYHILPIRKQSAESAASGTARNRGTFTIWKYAKWGDYSQGTYKANDFVDEQTYLASWCLQNKDLFL